MRIRISFCIIFIVLFASKTIAQNDPEAIRVLDALSSKAMKAPSIFMKFNLVTISQADNSNEKIEGNVLISKDKYRLTLPDNTMYFNGQTSWSYLPAEKEVTITRADQSDDSFMSKPSTIFTMYKKGYKCRLVEETSSSYIIDLYPDDIKSEMIRIRSTISKSDLTPVSFEYKRRDGITMNLNVVEFDLGQRPADTEFTFQPSKFRDVEVIDMR